MRDSSGNGRIPVFLVTGFLGAGKTTLINDMLARPGPETAVVVNEFGEIGMDRHFVKGADLPVVEISGACLCCSTEGQFGAAMVALPQDTERVVIECSGMADPAPTSRALAADPELSSRFSVGAVIAVLDVRTALTAFDCHEEAILQIAAADLVVLTRTEDQIEISAAQTIAKIIWRIRQLNPAAVILARRDLDDPAALLDIERALKPSPRKTREDLGSHVNHGELKSLVLTCETPVSRSGLDEFCALASSRFGGDLLRLKGLVRIQGANELLAVHCIHGMFDEPHAVQWPRADRATTLIAILRRGNPAHLRDIFAAMTGQIGPDLPDRDALARNPLAIPGTGGIG